VQHVSSQQKFHHSVGCFNMCVVGDIEGFWSNYKPDFGRQFWESLQLRSRSWAGCSWVIHRPWR